MPQISTGEGMEIACLLGTTSDYFKNYNFGINYFPGLKLLNCCKVCFTAIVVTARVRNLFPDLPVQMVFSICEGI